MGMDISMYIVKDGKYVEKNIFDGRNREWFQNLQNEGWDDCYNNLDIIFGISPQAPTELNIEKMQRNGYFGFYHIKVKRFKEWFRKYRPDRDAGWVSTYDKWRIENKGYVPNDVAHFLSADDNIEDMHFVEIINPYDCSAWLYRYLIEHDIDDNADITYWFDW